MPLDRTWLEQVPVLRTTARVYFRTAWLPPAGDPDPFHIRPNEGRWPTDMTLYTASSPEVAWAEYCRNSSRDVELADVTGGVGLNPLALASLGALKVGAPLPQRALFELTFVFERLADFLSPWGQHCLQEAGFPLADFYADPPGYGQCPQLSAMAGPLNWEALRVPSAALDVPDAFCVPVFASGLPRRTSVVRLAEAASPTVAVAYATKYPDGLRPTWLG
jgi:hypothetical protein